MIVSKRALIRGIGLSLFVAWYPCPVFFRNRARSFAYRLLAAVGERHGVGSSHGIAVRVLLGAEVRPSVVVLHLVGEVVWHSILW